MRIHELTNQSISHEPYQSPLFYEWREVHGQRVWIPRRRCDVPAAVGGIVDDDLWHSRWRTRQLIKKIESHLQTTITITQSNNRNNRNNHASPSRLCAEAENARVALVRGQASAGTILLLLDAVRPKPQNQNHVSNGVPTALWDHADQPHHRHGWMRWNRAPSGACEPIARRVVHCVAVVVARTGNVPEATAHSRLVEQFAAPRHEHAAPFATNATIANANAANAGNQVNPSHADPIQVIKILNQTKPNQTKPLKKKLLFF